VAVLREVVEKLRPDLVDAAHCQTTFGNPANVPWDCGAFSRDPEGCLGSHLLLAPRAEQPLLAPSPARGAKDIIPINGFVLISSS
jgi:hypothetical protein